MTLPLSTLTLLPIVTLTSSFVSASLSGLAGLFYRPILRLSILSPLRMPFRHIGQFIPFLLDTKMARPRQSSSAVDHSQQNINRDDNESLWSAAFS